MTEILVETMAPPYLGLDTESSPETIDSRRAPVLENLLPGRPGILVMRGDFTVYSGDFQTTFPDYTSTEILTGAWVFNDKIAVGRRTLSATSVRVPWRAPYHKASAANVLADGQLVVDVYDLQTGTNTKGTVITADEVPGPKSTRLGANAWGISFDTATAEVNENGGFMKLTSIVQWDGGTGAANFTPYVNAPRGAQDIKAYLNRLFVLGGRNPDGTGTIKFNTLYWSDEGGPTADTLAMWQDDVSGRVNQLEIDSDDRNDFGVALARIQNGLVIFKQRSLHVLWGSTPSSFILKTISGEVGCIDPRSVVEYEGGVFFMSDRGYMFFDGATITNMSNNIKTELTRVAQMLRFDDGGYIEACMMPNDFIALTTGIINPSTGVHIGTSKFYLLHIPTQSWCNATIAATFFDGNTIPSTPLPSSTQTFFFNGRELLNANYVTLPELMGTGFAGRDYNGVTYAAIPAKWHSKLFRLSSPLHKAQLLRLLLDYAFKTGTNDGDTNTWYVKLVDGTGATALPEYQVPNMGSSGTHLYRRRNTTEVFAEATDVQLQIRWTYAGFSGSVPACTNPPVIYNAVLGFSKARLRESS